MSMRLSALKNNENNIENNKSRNKNYSVQNKIKMLVYSDQKYYTWCSRKTSFF